MCRKLILSASYFYFFYRFKNDFLPFFLVLKDNIFLFKLSYFSALNRIICLSIHKKGASGDISGFPFIAGVLGYD